jgi:hypothetical protein
LEADLEVNGLKGIPDEFLGLNAFPADNTDEMHMDFHREAQPH